jgi:hypothetical protein
MGDRKQKVLFVDRSYDRNSILEELKFKKFNCDGVRTVDEAIEKINSGEYGVVFIPDLAINYNYDKIPQGYTRDTRFNEMFAYGMDVVKAAGEKGLGLIVLHSNLKRAEAEEIKKMRGTVLQMGLGSLDSYVKKVGEALSQ